MGLLAVKFDNSNRKKPAKLVLAGDKRSAAINWQPGWWNRGASSQAVLGLLPHLRCLLAFTFCLSFLGWPGCRCIVLLILVKG